MDVNVPEAVLSETKRCQHNFSCLETEKCGGKVMCDVKRVHKENILYWVSKEQINCPYRISFGEGQMCLCPTHYWYRNNK